MPLFKNESKDILAKLLIFCLIFYWIFSGWPQIYNFPPKINKAEAAVSFVGSAVNSSSPNTATSVNVSGIGIQEGDLILVSAAVGDSANNGLAAPTQGGYSRVPGVAATLYANTTNDTNLDLYYKIADGTETAVSFGAVGGTNASNAVIVMVFRGINTTSPFDTNANTVTGTGTSNADPPSHDWSGTSGVWTVIAASTGHTGGATASFTFPANYTTNAAQRAHNDTFDVLVGMGYKTSPADPEDPAAFSAANIGTASANSWAAVTMSLRPVVAPTVSTQAASSVEATTATGNGTIDATGGQNATAWGVCYKTSSGCTTADSTAAGSGSGGAGAFTASMTSLSPGTTYYIKAYATNSAGTSYGSEVTILTKPAAPTGVGASENLSDKVTIIWTKSFGATDYHVWRGGTDLGSAGDVATFNDTGGNAPTITPGLTVASDGSDTAQVDLSLSGTSANEGTSYDYTVVASNATGNSAASTADAGYRKVGVFTYQWQRSAANSDADYSSIDLATNSTYSDTAAPAPTVTPGTASATDGSATNKVTLSIDGDLANYGEARYYQCILNATGATQQISTANDGYRDVGSLTYLWYRSSGVENSGFSSLGATTDPYEDTTAPAPTITAGAADASDGTSAAHVVLNVSGQSANAGAGRYYYATVSATGASPQDTNHDSGNIGVGGLTYQWQRSASNDIGSEYSNIDGATSDSYNDTGAPADGSVRYYKVVEDATGADQQISTADPGNRLLVSISMVTGGSKDGTVAFGYINYEDSRDTTAGDLNDVEQVSIDSGPADLHIRSTNFTRTGGYTWALGDSIGPDTVKFEYTSSTPVVWYTFTANDTEYDFDQNVAQGQIRDIFLKITIPTSSGSDQQYNATITIVASAPGS